MGSFAPYLVTLGRLLLAPVFIQSGLSKIFDYADTQSLMEAHGLPGLLLAPTIIVEVLGGLGVLVGLGTRWRRWRWPAFASSPLSSSIRSRRSGADGAVLGEYLHGRRPLRTGRRRPRRACPRQPAPLAAKRSP